MKAQKDQLIGCFDSILNQMFGGHVSDSMAARGGLFYLEDDGIRIIGKANARGDILWQAFHYVETGEFDLHYISTPEFLQYGKSVPIRKIVLSRFFQMVDIYREDQKRIELGDEPWYTFWIHYLFDEDPTGWAIMSKDKSWSVFCDSEHNLTYRNTTPAKFIIQTNI